MRVSRTHYAANLVSATPKASWPWVRALLHPVHDQPDVHSMHAQCDRVLTAVADKLPRVAEHLEAAPADVLAFHRLRFRAVRGSGGIATAVSR